MFDDSDNEEEINEKQPENKKKTIFDLDDDASEEKLVDQEEDIEEFKQLLKNLKVNFNDINKNFSPLIQRIKDNKIELKNVYKTKITISSLQGLKYLESKNNILLVYSVYMAFYALLKSQGKLISSHPVIKKLLYLKYLIDKSRGIDEKINPQIDKLLNLSEEVSGNNHDDEENDDLPQSKKIKDSNKKKLSLIKEKEGKHVETINKDKSGKALNKLSKKIKNQVDIDEDEQFEDNFVPRKNNKKEIKTLSTSKEKSYSLLNKKKNRNNEEGNCKILIISDMLNMNYNQLSNEIQSDFYLNNKTKVQKLEKQLMDMKQKVN